MSGLRENLNPGLESERLNSLNLQCQQQQSQGGPTGPSVNVSSEVSVSIVVDPPSSDEADGQRQAGGGGHDSDPPIENDNPDDNGDECFDPKDISLSSAERNTGIENAKRRAQVHHRKRRKSVHNGDGSYVPPYKKNRFFRRQPSVLPSKFLLGGNIRDPLNLASLSDARISAELNQITPQSSPLPVQGQIPVYIPKNPHDPLGLTTKTPDNVEEIAGVQRNNSCSRKHPKHRHRKRTGRKRTDSECSIGTECEAETLEDETHTENKNNANLDKKGEDNKIRISSSEPKPQDKDKGENATHTQDIKIPPATRASNSFKRTRSSSNPEDVYVPVPVASLPVPVVAVTVTVASAPKPIPKDKEKEVITPASASIPSAMKSVASATATPDTKSKSEKEKEPSISISMIKTIDKDMAEVKQSKTTTITTTTASSSFGTATQKQDSLSLTVTAAGSGSAAVKIAVSSGSGSANENERLGVGVGGKKTATTTTENQESQSQPQPTSKSTSAYPTATSDYRGSTSTYSPNISPFAFDSTEYFLEAPPYESPLPSFSPFPYMYTPTHSYNLQPFSPPPLPEIPYFQQRMQMLAMRPQQQHMSLQRAVFHRPFNRKRTRHKAADPIVSPVIPQPGSRRRNHHQHQHQHQHHHKEKNPNPTASIAGTSQPKPSTSKTSKTFVAGAGAGDNLAKSKAKAKATMTTPSVGGGPGTKTNLKPNENGNGNGKKYRAKDKIFQFGNYSHYYGYRTADEGDPRLWVLKKEYFEGKDVLDIGCNSGHMTLSIARDFEPRRMHGVDIDFSLIAAARKNIRHFLVRDPDNKEIVFPKSLPIVHGAIQPPPVAGERSEATKPFPYNVSFAHENYVLKSDDLLENVKPEYDVITCFSVTKWIHLNYGDEGLKRFFKRVFLHLKDEGIFILEPQPWNSYMKKKKLTEKIHDMYQSIRFYPDHFEHFLLQEVGFSTVESLGTPVHSSKGFQRPLLLFRKSKYFYEPASDHDPYYLQYYHFANFGDGREHEGGPLYPHPPSYTHTPHYQNEWQYENENEIEEEETEGAVNTPQSEQAQAIPDSNSKEDRAIVHPHPDINDPEIANSPADVCTSTSTSTSTLTVPSAISMVASTSTSEDVQVEILPTSTSTSASAHADLDLVGSSSTRAEDFENETEEIVSSSSGPR